MLKFSEFFKFSSEISWILQIFWPNSDPNSSFGSVPRNSRTFQLRLAAANAKVAEVEAVRRRPLDGSLGGGFSVKIETKIYKN